MSACNVGSVPRLAAVNVAMASVLWGMHHDPYSHKAPFSASDKPLGSITSASTSEARCRLGASVRRSCPCSCSGVGHRIGPPPVSRPGPVDGTLALTVAASQRSPRDQRHHQSSLARREPPPGSWSPARRRANARRRRASRTPPSRQPALHGRASPPRERGCPAVNAHLHGARPGHGQRRRPARAPRPRGAASAVVRAASRPADGAPGGGVGPPHKGRPQSRPREVTSLGLV